MATANQSNEFCVRYPLVEHRRSRQAKDPAPHQTEALGRLDQWFRSTPPPPRGGILVLPTGGGKTFTATHFACRVPLSAGCKVLWLAHTHHLLEQAFASFGQTAGRVAEPKQELAVRVVSGTAGHFPVHTIKPGDDVLIGSLQTFANAAKNRHPAFLRFLEAAGKRLFVVFDEAHHAPAPSYRGLVGWLRERCDGLYLLGLTATPLHTDEGKSGWLKKIFPQGILAQTTANALMAQGFLARPVIEEARTAFAPDFDEREYQKWTATHQDLPEDIISKLAESQERNDCIVAWYVQHRKKYGKTLVFADRWYQCEYLREALLKKKVRADAVYSHVEADLGSAEARNRRTAAENAQVLERFRRNDLDVLINVRILTEGTDVPDVQTVFLTRQTTSSILLTQMVGRALRGSKFGGTESAYIVSFLDDWKHRINWAAFNPLQDGPADPQTREYEKRPPLHLVSIELVRRLARQMDSGANINPGPFTSLLPAGWYLAEYTARVGDTDDLEPVTQLVLVFEDDRGAFEGFLGAVRNEDLSAFEGEGALLDDGARALLGGWRRRFFCDDTDRVGGDHLDDDLFVLLRHLAQNDRRAPQFFSFDARRDHDLDAVAQRAIDADLGPRQADEALRAEYERSGRYWRVLYPTYHLFRSHYDGCVSRLLDAIRHGRPSVEHRPQGQPREAIPHPEPDEEVKEQVRSRDGHRCLCCGYDRRASLQVDHIDPRYFGGRHDPNNLQTLCTHCNNAKGIKTITFRIHRTTLTMAPGALPEVQTPRGAQAKDKERWEMYIRRVVNLFYQCAAVRSVVVGAKGDNLYRWQVSLFAGNDPRWLKPHKPEILRTIQEAREAAGYTVAPLEILFTN
jgi:superfamily II DNA or RNA helicase/5-methylcytosine-specific restriction endonuclease McrA